MSRRIFKRRSGVITGDLLQDPVADIAALRLIAARDVDDGQLVLVKDVNNLFSFVYGDATPDDGTSVIAPTYDTSVGRWKKIAFSGGGSGDFADKWVDVSKILSTETVTVDADLADDDPNEVRREVVDVEGTLDVVNGTVHAIPTTEHFTTNLSFGYASVATTVTDEEFLAAGVANGQGFRVPYGGVVKALSLYCMVNAASSSTVSLQIWKNGVAQGADYTLVVNHNSLDPINAQIDFETPLIFEAGDRLTVKLTSTTSTTTLNHSALLWLFI